MASYSDQHRRNKMNLKCQHTMEAAKETAVKLQLFNFFFAVKFFSWFGLRKDCRIVGRQAAEEQESGLVLDQSLIPNFGGSDVSRPISVAAALPWIRSKVIPSLEVAWQQPQTCAGLASLPVPVHVRIVLPVSHPIFDKDHSCLASFKQPSAQPRGHTFCTPQFCCPVCKLVTTLNGSLEDGKEPCSTDIKYLVGYEILIVAPHLFPTTRDQIIAGRAIEKNARMEVGSTAINQRWPTPAWLESWISTRI